MAQIHITTPPTPDDILAARAGDEVLFTGRLLTARDKAHRWLLENDYPPMHNAVLYHCGPMYEKHSDDDITILAAGPTTSARFNHYTPEVIKKYNIQAIIGKGGMDAGVRSALGGQGIYCAAIGGAAVYYADCIKKVISVSKTEFGMTDAIWEFEVENFPVICMIDSVGDSLYDEVEESSKSVQDKLNS